MSSPDPIALFDAGCSEFDRRVQAIGASQWESSTPCPGWDVRAIVNHLAVEDLWVVEIFAGRTIAEVGSRFDGDQLGDDPVASWDEAVEGARQTIRAPGAMEQIVHLSFGDVPGSEYTMQLFADHLIHAWDLAVACDLDRRLDPDLVHACAHWFAEREDGYRSGGFIGPRATAPDDADEQASLLAAFGRVPD